MKSSASEIKYILEPPDGGWAYMIVLGFILINAINGLIFLNFGIIYGEFLRQSGDETTSTALLNSTFGVCSCIVGLLTNKLITDYSLRLNGYIGAAIYCLGVTGSIFVQTVPQLVITFGVIQGFGYGILQPTVYTIFTRYFNKKRKAMNCFGMAATAGIYLSFPIIIENWIEYYGTQGTYILIAGLSYHIIFAVTLFQPVEWHMIKRVPTFGELIEPEKIKVDCGAPLTPLATPRPSNLLVVRQRQKSLHLGENKTVTKLVELTHDVQIEPDQKPSLRSRIYDILDLSQLKNLVFVNVAIGLAISVVSDLSFVNNIPIVLFNRGFSRKEIAFFMSISSSGDLISRIAQFAFNIAFKVKGRYSVLVGIIFGSIIRIALIFADNATAQYLVMSIGFFRSLVFVPAPIALAECCDQKRFPAAFGLYMLLMSFSYVLIGGSTIVLSKTFSNDSMTLALFAGISILTSISWILEIGWTKLKSRKN